MECKIEIVEHFGRKMVHARLKGEMTEEERNRIAIEAIGQMRNHGLNLAIWDIREATLAYSLIGSHKIVLNLSAPGLRPDDRVAVIYQHNREHHQHSARVAQNRGIINLRYFRKPDEGIRWLADRS
ncbi:MAG: hypothetical protein Kow00127_07790 [Bacteroidales bacterium]